MGNNGFRLTIPVEIDKTGVGKSIIDAFLAAQKEADSKKIKFGTELQSNLSKDIGKELMAFTKNLKPIQLDKLFKDDKIKNSVLETIDQIDKLDEKIKELERTKSTPIKFDKEFVSGEITKVFNDVYDDIKDENDDLKFDSKAKTAAKKLFKSINQIIKESGNPEEVKKLIKSDDQWDYDLTELGEEFKLKLDFTPVKKDNSELEKLVKERDELFDRLTGKYMEWSGVNLNEILNKMSGEVELVPKLSDNFKADAEALVNGLNLEADVNLIGKIDEENFIDFESLTRVLENITRTFSSMQEDGKFSLNLIDKKEIEELKGHVQSLNEFTDLLKISKTGKVQVSNGKLLQAFVEENERQDIFGTFERIKNNENYDERSGGMFFVENPNTGEIYDSYNGLIDLLKELANEYEIAGDKAENFNLFINSASRGMKYYEDLEVAWANLAEHIVDTTGKSIYGAPSYYKEVEKTSTVFHEISEGLKNATSIISDSLTDIIEQLELINQKEFNITIESMNNLNDATSNTINNVLKLGTVLKLIAEADIINRDLLIEDPVEKNTKDKRVTKERGLIYNSKTGKLSNPFTWDHSGSVHWDTYEKLGFKLYGGDQGWDTMIHSHSGDDVLVPSMSQGDMAVAISRYLNEGIKNHIIVATNEIMELDMDVVREAFEKQYGLLSDAQFRTKWFDFVKTMESETRVSQDEYAMSRMNANELDYFARNGTLNIYKEKYDPFDKSLGDSRLKSKLKEQLDNLGYGSSIDEAYKTLMSILEKFNGQKINTGLQDKIKDSATAKFRKMFGEDGGFVIESFWNDYFQYLIDSFINSTKYFYTNDKDIDKGGQAGKEARARRNYWLQLIRPGLDDAIESHGLQKAFHFYTPEEFEKQSKYKINLGDGDLNLEDDEVVLRTTEGILEEILQLLKDIGEEGKLSFNFDSNGLNNIKQNLDDIKKDFIELLNFINKLSNFNLNKMDNPIRANPLSLFVKNTDLFDVFESIFPENENGKNEFNLSKAFSMKDIGKSHTEINKKLKEFFNGYGVEYSSIIGYLESLSEILDIKNILNTDSLTKFENAMNYLKNNSDIMNKNFFSQIDLKNIEIASKQLDEIITPMFGKQSFLDLINNILPQTYESVQSTIFDSILNTIKNLQTTGLPVGNLNIDSLEISAQDIRDIISAIEDKNRKFEDEERIVKETTENEKGYLEQLENAIRQFASNTETILKGVDFSILSTKIDDVIKEISEKKIELNFDIEDLDDEKITKLNNFLDELKRNIFGNESGGLNIDLLSNIFNNADFKNIDTDKLQEISRALKEIVENSNGGLTEENSFIQKLQAQLENLLQLSSKLETFVALIKELKNNLDGIGNIPDIIPDDDSGGDPKKKPKKKKKKKQKTEDDSEVGRQLNEYDKSINAYYATLNKIARGTATKRDVSINTVAYQEMVRLEEELANNTSKTNEQQKRYNELLSKSKSLMDDLNNNSQNIAKLLFDNSNIDLNSSSFSHIEERYNELQGKIGQVNDYESLKGFKEELRSITQDYQAFEKLYSKFGTVQTFGSYSEAINKIKQDALEYGRIIKEVGDVQPDGSGMAKYTITVKAATGETKQLAIQWNEAIKSIGLSEKYLGEQRRFGLLGFFDNVKKKIYDVTSYLAGVYLSPMDWIRYIREGINYVKEMDTALTEMRKVSDESLESLKRYQLTTFDTAQRIGTTATDLQKSTADWMRLGESLSEASESAEATAVLSNVSEFESIDEATKALVAVSQAYTDLDKMSIIDKLNEVGNNYSISTDELASGLQRSSSTLSLMGNTIDEAAALITAGNATIQNAESVATGIKVISLRLVGTKEAKEELKVDGEDIEDAFIQMTESKKQQIIKDYTAVASNNYQGFDILDENGNYKNTYEILLGISKIYKEIQAEDKKFGTNRANALIEELAGKVRSNIVAAVLQNGSMLESVKGSSEKASGSAMRENEKYLDSVEGRINQLTTGIEEFWNKAINSDDLKIIIQFLTNMLDIVNNIVGQIGSIPTLLSVLSPLALNKSGLSLFSYGALKDENGEVLKKDGKIQYGFQGLFHDMFANNNVAEELNEIADAEENVNQKSLSLNKGLSGLSSVFSSLGNLGKALVASLVEMVAVTAIFWAISAVIKFTDTLVNGDKQIIESGKQATESIKNTFDTYNDKVSSLKSVSESLSDDGKIISDNAEALDNLGKKYVELSNGVNSFDNSNISLTNEEYQTFLDTSNKIAEVLPELVNRYDENGNAMLTLGDNAEEASKKIDEALKTQELLAHHSIIEDSVAEMKGISEQNRLYNRDKAQSDETIREIEEWIRGAEEGRNLVTATEEERLEAITQKYRELAEEKENNNAIDKIMKQNYDSFIPTLQGLLKTDYEFTSLNETIQEKLINNISNLSSDAIKEIIDNSDGDAIKLMSYLDKVYIDPFEKLEEKGMTDDLIDLFNLDYSDMKFNKYVEKIKERLNELFDGNTKQVAQWETILGIDNLKEQDRKIESILSDTTDNVNVTKEQFDKLTMGDRDIAYDLIVNNKFEGTFKELKEKIAEIKKDLNEKDLFATPLLDSYNKAVEDAGENGNQGKNYDQYGAALKSLKEQYDKGLVGTDTFKKGAKMFSIGGAIDADNFIENYKKISKYFDEEDPAKGLKKFVNDMTKLNLMEKTEDGGFKTTFENIREGAKKAKMPLELFISMFDKLEEFGGYNDFFATKEEGFATIGELTGELAIAQAEYAQLLDTQPKNKSAIKAKEEEVKSLQERLKDAQDQLLKFLKNGGLETYTENYKKQRSAAQEALNGLNTNVNFQNADEDQKRIMLESIRAGFEDSGLDSSIYKGLGINKNGKIVLDVQSSNKRIESVLEAYKNITTRDKKFERYGNKTAEEIVEQWAKDAGLTVGQYLKNMEITPTDFGIENINGVDTLSKDGIAIDNNTNAIRDEISALKENTNALLGKNNEPTEVTTNDNVDLSERPVVPSKVMNDMGWMTPKGSKSTIASVQYTGEDGTEYLFTPILPNGDVFEKENFEEYMNYVINGGEDEYNLLIASFEGGNARKAADDYSHALHEVHDAFYLGDEAAKESLYSLRSYTSEQLKAIDLTDESTDEMEDSFVSLMEQLNISEDQAEQFINVLEQMGLLHIEPDIDMSSITSIDTLSSALSSQLDVGGSVKYTANVDDIMGDSMITAVEEQEGVIKYYAENLEGVQQEVEPYTEQDGTINYRFKPVGENPADNNKDKDGGTITTETDMDTSKFDKGKKEVEQGVHTLSQQEAKPGVTVEGVVNANNQLNNFMNKIKNLDNKHVKVTLTTIKETIIKANKSGNKKPANATTQFNGTFHLSSGFHTSNAYARGTTVSSDVSIQKDETALINELGKEIVVRDGKALTFNNGYPVYANLKRGDLIFNHKQTEELERKGYVTGSHAKIYGGTSAFADGTFDILSNAYYGNAGGKFSGGASTTTKKKSTTTKKSKTTKNPKQNTKDKKKNTSDKKWDKFEKWLGKFFDWIEIRLDALSAKTEKWTNLFEKFLNASSTNAQNAYNAAMNAAKTQQNQSATASDKYLRQALKVGYKGADLAGKGITHEWVNSMYQRILDGSLDKNSLQKMSEKRKSIIDAMQGYIDKAKTAADTTFELTDSINDLIKAQRDANIEFRKKSYSSAVEGNNGYSATVRNSGLAISSNAERYAINQYNSSLTNGYSYLSSIGKQAKDASAEGTDTNKKILGTLKDTKKNKAKTKYQNNLKSAKNAINAKKMISSSVINYFSKMNPSLAAKYQAWNTQLVNMENMRIEAADGFAESMATIMDNIQQSYTNIDEDTERAISLAESKADNALDYTAANDILKELYTRQAEIIANDDAEIKTYETMSKSYLKGVNTNSYKGNQYNTLGTTGQKNVDDLRNKAVTEAKSGMISDSTMMKLYDYFSKGYISASFYESCRAFNFVAARSEEAIKQKEIDEQTQKQQNKETFSKIVSNIDSANDRAISMIEARKASIHGNYDDSATQGEIIKQRVSYVSELEVALNEALTSGVIEAGSKEWMEYAIKIQEAKNEVNELKDTQFETVLAEKFDRAIEKAQDFIDKLETINGLINDEMLYDRKSGELTSMGWMSIGLNSQAMAKEQNSFEKYMLKRKEIIEAYEEGNNSYFGDQSFDEMIRENAENILSSISGINSYKEAILDLIEGQADAELEALQKVVDKRKEALQKKKEYYDYDKTIKGKTKDLQALEQQIRALEGVSGQEAAAKRANLLAQRQEMQEDLDEAVKEHIYNMQVEGLDDMMSGLQDGLEEWRVELRSNLEAQAREIKEFRQSVEDRDSYDEISKFLTALSEKTISTEDVKGIFEDASKTLSDENTVNVNVEFNGENVDGTQDTTKGSSNNVDTSTGETTILETPNVTVTATTAEPTDNPVSKEGTDLAKGAEPKEEPKQNTGKTDSGNTGSKQTVSKANVEKAFDYILGSLKYASSQNKNWGNLNKKLYNHDKNRQVYLPADAKKKAWKLLGSPGKYSDANLLDALKKTGIWTYLVDKVRTDSKGHIKYSGAASAAIKGYASGGIVHRSGHYLTDEKGEEIIVTKQGILRPLSAGTSIIPADITERLYAIASNYDMGASTKVNGIDISKLERIGGDTISPIINCPITIEGNANEQDVINAINKTLPKISKHVQNDIRKDLRKSGR